MRYVAALVFVLLMTLPSASRSAAPASKSRTHEAHKTRKAQSKKKSPESTAKIPSDRWATAPAAPGTLQAMARGLLQNNSTSDQHDLEQFAHRHRDDVNGALAQLALGYHDYQEQRYSEARKHFETIQQSDSPLRDYGEYYLALSYIAEGDHAAGAKILDGFPARYPASPFAAQSILKEADSLLTMGRNTDAIRLLASPSVALSVPAANLLLGDAYRKDQQFSKAAQALQEVYYAYPTSWQADGAETRLRDLKSEMGDAFPAPSEKAIAVRAEGLFDGKQWKDAEAEYRALSAAASGAAREHARVRVGVCQFRAGDTREALTTLKGLDVSDPDANAERLYTLAAIYRRLEQPENMEAQIAALEQTSAQSPWYARALFLGGSYYFVSSDLDRAADDYTKVFELNPDGENAADSHWRVAWQRYRQRQLPEARKLLADHLRNYPSSPQVPAAIYWLGRTLEAESPAKAALCYKKLVATFPNYYYGLVARQRLASLPAVPVSEDTPEALESSPADVLGPIRRPVPESALDGTLSASEQEHLSRAKLLESAWLIDLAIGELRSAIGKDATSFSLGWEVAHLEEERGRYYVALDYAKHLLTGYFAFDMAELPREKWELLFPLPWWGEIKRQAEALQLDPYLVAGLIRQESAFNPEARSRSNARGLMQLLPTTAQRMAKQIRSHYSLSSLNVPASNVAYGTTYLRMLLDMFNGSLEQATAGYNAGEHRVVKWLDGTTYEEPAEFVESIPFTETREYVQAVLRNAALYRKLYQDAATSHTGPSPKVVPTSLH